jgi:hypothetical protein
MKGAQLMEIPKYYRRQEVHAYLYEKYKISASVSYLAKLAVIGGSPKFHKCGRFPIYSESALDAWAESKMGELVSSTSEYSQKAA